MEFKNAIENKKTSVKETPKQTLKGKHILINDVYFIFSEGGIEDKIFESVCNKKDYTLNKFNQDYGLKVSK